MRNVAEMSPAFTLIYQGCSFCNACLEIAQNYSEIAEVAVEHIALKKTICISIKTLVPHLRSWKSGEKETLKVISEVYRQLPNYSLIDSKSLGNLLPIAMDYAQRKKLAIESQKITYKQLIYQLIQLAPRAVIEQTQGCTEVHMRMIEESRVDKIPDKLLEGMYLLSLKYFKEEVERMGNEWTNIEEDNQKLVEEEIELQNLMELNLLLKQMKIGNFPVEGRMGYKSVEETFEYLMDKLEELEKLFNGTQPEETLTVPLV